MADGDGAIRMVTAALVIAVVAGVPLVLFASVQRSQLLAAVVGAVGVASWFLPLVLPGLGTPR